MQSRFAQLSSCTGFLLAAACGGGPPVDSDSTHAGDTQGGGSTSSAQTSMTTLGESGQPSASDTGGSSGFGSGTDGDSSGSTGTTTNANTGSTEDGSESSGGDTLGPGLYVHAGKGLNSNPGTEDAPLRTIQWALNSAIEDGYANVFVAAGEYTSNTENAEPIDIPGGVSLLGGFSADDWNVRDPAIYETMIAGTGDFVVRISGGSRDDTQVDGLSLESLGDNPTAVMVIDGSPTVRRNRVRRWGGVNVVGILIAGGSPRISRNQVYAMDSIFVAGTVGGSTATGIRVAAGGATMDSNMIYANGQYGGYEYGVGVEILGNAAVGLYGNSVRAAGEPGVALAGSLESTTIVGNNLIAFDGTQSDRVCIDSTTFPAALTHNNFDCDLLYATPEAFMTTLAELHADVPGAAQNVAVALQYEGGVHSSDLHIANADTLLCEVAVGGFEHEPPLDQDFDGSPRTAPWSIGAEEHDTPCT